MAVVFFDVDHTLIPHTSVEALFIRWLLFHGKIPPRNFLGVAYFFLRHLDDIGGTAIRGNKMYVKGLSVEDLKGYADRVAHQWIKNHISLRGIQVIQQLKKEGKRVVLLSASPLILIRYVQMFVGADDSIATELEIIDGRCAGFIHGIHPYGAHKVTAAREYVERFSTPLSDCSAYANAYSDLALLQSVGYPVAVHPDRQLLRYARNVGWRVEHF